MEVRNCGADIVLNKAWRTLDRDTSMVEKGAIRRYITAYYLVLLWEKYIIHIYILYL